MLEPCLGSDYAEVFREARVEAERIALSKSATEETTLEAIWQELANILPAIDPVEGIRRELSTETEYLVPVSETRTLVARARAAGKRIVFISDTYLPSRFIQSQLARAGFLEPGDTCFVSSEIGKTKRRKSLFGHVLSHLTITPAQLHHHGDDPISDVAIPQGLGIHAQLIQTTKLNSVESELAKSLSPTDDVWAGRLVGEMRAFRVGVGDTGLSAAATSLSAGLIGPALTAIAIWILRKAERDGVQTLYFLARDGYALHCVADDLAKYLELPIQCRYLQVSRQALLLPSTSVISPEGMPWLRRHFETPRIQLLAGKLDLPVDLLVQELQPLIGDQGGAFVIESEEQWRFFWKKLSEGKLASELRDRIKERRNTLLLYLEQEGIFDERSMGCVDLGWFQSCQAALIKVCRSVKPDFELKGYYLSLANGRGAYLNLGMGQAMLHQAPHDRRRLGQEQLPLQYATLLEHLLSCAPHGTVHHYEYVSGNSGKVAASCGVTNPLEQRAKKELADSALAFTKHGRWMTTMAENRLQTLIVSLIKAAINEPDARWFPLVAQLTASTDQNNHETLILVRRSKLREAMHALIKGRSFYAMDPAITGLWPQLSLIATPGKTYFLYRISGALNSIKRALKEII